MTLKGACVLITGGTGSFDTTVLDRLLSLDVAEIRIFSRDEKKQEDLRVARGEPRLRFIIGDVRDHASIHRAMRGVDAVFHAAALKQVPSCEFYPMEALRTNVLGAEHVMDAAIACGVGRVVFLSTDKAVYPINAMGMTKALMEKLVVAKARTQQAGETVLCATRYGNVMGSRGSVIPLFVEQIASGKPLTITDANMTRFMMSLDDSVDLVLHAFEHGRQGDIFVQRAPAATIGVLAQALMQVFDKRVDIKVIGTRHGEKLYESLLSREEMARAEDHGRYYRIPADDRDLNYNKYFVEGEPSISQHDDYTSHNTERLTVAQLAALLRGQRFIQDALHG